MAARSLLFVVTSLVLATVSVWATPASAGGDPVDGAPSGNIAFFVGLAECPSGWTLAPDAAGRLVVAVDDPTLAGVTVGAPLTNAEDRTHTHGVSASFVLPSRSIAAVGGSNRAGAANGTVTLTGETSAAATGLPFVQVLVCERP